MHGSSDDRGHLMEGLHAPAIEACGIGRASLIPTRALEAPIDVGSGTRIAMPQTTRASVCNPCGGGEGGI